MNITATDALLIDILFIISIALLLLSGLVYYLIITEVNESFEEDNDSEVISRNINSNNIKGER